MPITDCRPTSKPGRALVERPAALNVTNVCVLMLIEILNTHCPIPQISSAAAGCDKGLLRPPVQLLCNLLLFMDMQSPNFNVADSAGLAACPRLVWHACCPRTSSPQVRTLSNGYFKNLA